MKRLAALLLLAASCSPPAPPAPTTSPTPTTPTAQTAPKPWTAGKDFAPSNAAPIATIERATPDKEVQIEGVVTRVCQGAGCWIELSQGDARVIAKSPAHDVLFPKDCVGRKACVLGILRASPGDEGEGGGGDEECPKPRVFVEVLGARLY